MACEKCEGTKCRLDKEGHLVACECDPTYFEHGVDLNDVECDMCQGTGEVSMNGYESGYSFGNFTCECKKE